MRVWSTVKPRLGAWIDAHPWLSFLLACVAANLVADGLRLLFARLFPDLSQRVGGAVHQGLPIFFFTCGLLFSFVGVMLVVLKSSAGLRSPFGLRTRNLTMLRLLAMLAAVGGFAALFFVDAHLAASEPSPVALLGR